MLVVSTDPAHSLGDALDRRLGPRPTRVPTRRGRLDAVELDAGRALERWLAPRRRHFRTLLERGTYLDSEDIDRFLRLSLPGVDELIGLVELRRLAGGAPYDEVVVDAAPTGHMLRFLAMPATLRGVATVLDDLQAKHRLLAGSLGGGHRPDATAALVDEVASEGRDLEALLRDPRRALFAWVALPEVLALEESADAVRALEKAGLAVTEIIVNRVTPPRRCPACAARAAAERAVLDAVREVFHGRPLRLLPDLDAEPRGQAALRRVARGLKASARGAAAEPWRPPAGRAVWGPRTRETPGASRTPRGARGAAAEPDWLDRLVPRGLRLLVVAGKGGVGKTTCAAALALGLARRYPDRQVLLLSADPAHSIADALLVPVGDVERALPGAPPNLCARELDAERAFAQRRARYQEAVDRLFTALTGGRFDVTCDRVVVRDLIDLAPPGLDELLAMLAVIEALFPPPDGRRPCDTVVLDTAPTGHALRLLELPGPALEWVHALLAILLKYREVIGLGALGAELVDAARDLRRLQALLTDRERTRFVAVTRPAELPRRETRRLLAGLARLRVVPAAVLVNAVATVRCAHGARSREEARALAALRRDARSCPMVLAPAVVPPPRGLAALERWRSAWRLEQERGRR